MVNFSPLPQPPPPGNVPFPFHLKLFPVPRAAQDRTGNNSNRNNPALQKEAETHIALYLLYFIYISMLLITPIAVSQQAGPAERTGSQD